MDAEAPVVEETPAEADEPQAVEQELEPPAVEEETTAEAEGGERPAETETQPEEDAAE